MDFINIRLLHCILLTACIATKLIIADQVVTHPRLYFSKKDLPHLQSKKDNTFFHNVLQQYEDALLHQLNYSAGGVMVDVENGPGTRQELATTLFISDFGENSTNWGMLAKTLVYKEALSITPATGNWFAGSERNLEQLIASYDVLAELFTPEEKESIEHAFAVNANYMYSSIGVAKDMASRLMNPAADRLAAIGLIALTLPNHENSTKWLDQAVYEFKWMLSNGVMEDGQWHEPTTRYHGRVLAAFIPFAFALREAGILDAFNDMPNFKKYVGWYRHVQTPQDRTMGGCSLTPALSDGNWETVWSVTLGWAAAAYVKSDPTYAMKLWKSWLRACAPFGLEPSPPAQLSSYLFIGCIHSGECGDQFAAPFTATNIKSNSDNNSNNNNNNNNDKKNHYDVEFQALLPIEQNRQSTLLSSYAVLEQPLLASRPYFIMSTSTQRQTEGHEHPDRGSFSLYSHNTPIVLDPGVGWCGYNWFGTIPPSRYNGTAFDKDLQFGAWYRGSQSHSMVNFAKEGPDILPEKQNWRPAGAFGHEWGLRGAAWVESHIFSSAMDYVDLNITRAVQASQLAGVNGYHRRVFANRRDGSYLLWDDINAPIEECSQATYNLHVVTQLGWPGKIGCFATGVPGDDDNVTRLECNALNDLKFDFTILQPSSPQASGLLHVEADPLPTQFTGMTGSAGSVPEYGQTAVGGALGGDWNAAQNVAPSNAHWKPRTATWIRINAAAVNNKVSTSCTGFLTLLQPRNMSETQVIIDSFETLNNGNAFEVQTSGGTIASVNTIYLLGMQLKLKGLATVIGLTKDQSSKRLDYIEFIQASMLDLPEQSIRIITSANVTLTIKSPSKEQYILRIHSSSVGSKPTMVTIMLPWDTPPPKQVNVWRGSHVWHVANTTLNAGNLEPIIHFEALLGLDYLIERQCIRSMKAGYGDGGWLCNPGQPYQDEL